jgi:hypothetical protein
MDVVCARISTGELVGDVCADIGVTPWAITNWAAQEPFAPLYARARERQAHAIAEKAYREAEAAHGDSASVQAARLRFDAGRWLASKIAPKVYGDKLDVTSGGERVGLEALVLGASKRLPTATAEILALPAPLSNEGELDASAPDADDTPE